MALSLSPKLPSRMWAMQKEIKDAYQRRYATCSKGMFKKKRIGHMKVQVIKKRVGHMKVQVYKKKKEKR